MTDPSSEDMAEYRDWIATRPPAVRAVMDRFPPAGRVKARNGRVLRCPAPGEVATVVRYLEADDGRVTVGVLPRDRALPLDYVECDPDWLELIEAESEEQVRLYEHARGPNG